MYLFIFICTSHELCLFAVANTLIRSHGMTIVLLWHVNLFHSDQCTGPIASVCVSVHILPWINGAGQMCPCASSRCENESVSRNVSPFQIDCRKMAKFMITSIIIINHVIWRLAIFYSPSLRFSSRVHEMLDAQCTSNEKQLNRQIQFMRIEK